jgi:DNA polymerase-3 subunit delta
MPTLTREDLRNQLKRRDIAPVYVLFGAESYLRDIAAKTIADLLFKEGELRDFNETEFSLNSTDIGSALAAAEQLPMMAERRVVRIADIRVSATGTKDNLKEDHEGILSAYLKRPAESSVLIFIADELDKRRKMSKLLLENSVAVEFARFNDNELLAWARNKIKESGADVDEKAIHQLVALVGDDVRRLTNEINKLATAAMPDGPITYDLVESLVPNSRELSNFALTDHLMAGRGSRALQVLRKILEDGGEPLMILGLISYNYHRLFLAKEMMADGAERSEVAKVMKLRYSDQENFLASARRTDRAKLTRIMKRIAETDLAIKTSKGGGGPHGSRMQIEMLVCELATI